MELKMHPPKKRRGWAVDTINRGGQPLYRLRVRPAELAPQFQVGVFQTIDEADRAGAAAVKRIRGVMIPLTIRRQVAFVHLNNGMRSLIDAEDWERVAARGLWTANTSPRTDGWYAVNGRCRERQVRLHQFVLNVYGQLIDHRNGDSLDNRKENLRPCSPRMNSANCRTNRRNTTGFKGVSIKCGRFIAQIKVAGAFNVNLGSFATAEEAARAYDAAAREHFGEFACTNFPQGKERPARPQK